MSIDEKYLPSKYVPLGDESDSGCEVLASWVECETLFENTK